MSRCLASLALLCLAPVARAAAELGTLADGSACRSSNDAVTIEFSNSHLVHSNLGGQGPHYDAPPTLLLTNVGRFHGHRIDLEIANLSDYARWSEPVNFNDAGYDAEK